MYYLIGRDLDADGRYEFIQDMDNMILTEDANRALQVSGTELDYIDMAYLNEVGFYAMEADRFQVSLLEALLFRPRVRGYRPRVAPPPRRRAPRRYAHAPHHRPAPRRPHTVGVVGSWLGAILDPAPGPAPHRTPRPKSGPKPKPRKAPKPRAAARPAARRPAAPGAGRRPAPAGRPKPGGRGRR